MSCENCERLKRECDEARATAVRFRHDYEHAFGLARIAHGHAVQARVAERAAVIKWLRERFEAWRRNDGAIDAIVAEAIADSIEAGKHRKEDQA